jgi:hypothetical protein
MASLPSINKESYYLKQLPAYLLWVFVGMSSVAIIPSIVRRRWNFSGLFLCYQNLFVGMGGKLEV